MTDWLRKPGRGVRAGLAAVGLGLASMGASGEIDVVVSTDDHAVGVIASDASRREILEALAAQGLLVVVSAEALDQRVDFEAGPLAPGDLVRRLLRHDSYMYVEQPGIDQVWVFAKGAAQPGTGWRASHVAVPGQLTLDLTDPDPDVRVDAVLAAAELAPASVYPLLLPATQDPAPDVREAAEAVLEDIGATDYRFADRLTE